MAYYVFAERLTEGSDGKGQKVQKAYAFGPFTKRGDTSPSLVVAKAWRDGLWHQAELRGISRLLNVKIKRMDREYTDFGSDRIFKGHKKTKTAIRLIFPEKPHDQSDHGGEG